MQIVKVAVSAATYSIDKPYDYLCAEPVLPGQRVLVPFGRGNRVCEGMVLSVSGGAPDKPCKPVREILDSEPVIREQDIHLALWMHHRYYCTVYDALHTILPAAVWYHYREIWHAVEPAPEAELTAREETMLALLRQKPAQADDLSWDGDDKAAILHSLARKGVAFSTTVGDRKVRDRTVTMVSLAVSPEDAAAKAESLKRAPRQADALRTLIELGELSDHDLCYFTGVSREGIRRLMRDGILQVREQEIYRIHCEKDAVKGVPITLNPRQDQVFRQLLEQSLSGKAGVTLLHGVTGSGKTLIYIRLAQELLAAGKTVMILVPEIVLTPQMMARFTAYFGNEVALLHSALRLSERYDQYKRIRRGEARIVLGTRSAVFAPLENVALIVLDEEQEGSYESESAPCYHARDIAKYRCAKEGARLVLGSATPTVETFYYARCGDYALATLDQRYNDRSLPRVIVADMRQELRRGGTGLVSRVLAEEIRQNLSRGEQSILFLNRRGNSRQLLCPSCGYVPQCPRCSVYLTYHSANGRLMCHHCGHSESAVEQCPECGGIMKRLGIGTQKVEDEIHTLFPGVPVLRMDADTVGEGHEKILREFERERVPILLGTQMVAKGLDFDNVTLVGVLAADMSLYVDHYRASERTFSLLTQVVGRAGRGDKEGRAVIQTFTPENDVILAAAAQDYERYFQGEIRLRKLRHDPPFCDQTVITVTGPEEQAVRRGSAQIAEALRTAAKAPEYADRGWSVFGPAPAPVVKVNERYRYRVTLSGRNDTVLRGVVSSFMKEFARRKENKKMAIFADCNLMD